MLREAGLGTCPSCRDPLPPEAAQLFNEANNRCIRLSRKVREGRGWADLSPDIRAEMDSIRAVFPEAAGEGLAAAQVSLGMIFLEGRGVERDMEEASKWMLLAAEQGNQCAQ